MKKNFLLWMGVVLMMVIGMSSCSNDEDNDGEGKHTFLTIMSFPENGKLKPQLVYVYQRMANMEGEFVFVDAQTGQLLHHRQYWGGSPFPNRWD